MAGLGGQTLFLDGFICMLLYMGGKGEGDHPDIDIYMPLFRYQPGRHISSCLYPINTRRCIERLLPHPTVLTPQVGRCPSNTSDTPRQCWRCHDEVKSTNGNMAERESHAIFVEPAGPWSGPCDRNQDGLTTIATGVDTT